MSEADQSVPMYFHEFAIKNEKEHSELGGAIRQLEGKVGDLDDRVGKNATTIRNWIIGTFVIGGGSLTGLNQLIS